MSFKLMTYRLDNPQLINGTQIPILGPILDWALAGPVYGKRISGYRSVEEIMLTYYNVLSNWPFSS